MGAEFVQHYWYHWELDDSAEPLDLPRGCVCGRRHSQTASQGSLQLSLYIIYAFHCACPFCSMGTNNILPVMFSPHTFHRRPSVFPTSINPGWRSWPGRTRCRMLCSHVWVMRQWVSFFLIYSSSLRCARNLSLGILFLFSSPYFYGNRVVDYFTKSTPSSRLKVNFC